ncbi:MAG: cytochrome C, partial [Thermodesulfobacteriota bacterium]|nr:cytochrome C [Thermodesulfobacteriota bacterium]
MKRKWIVILGCSIAMFCFTSIAIGAEEACITCHRDISPGQVADWASSKHSEEDVTCSVCHGEEH